MAEAAPAPAFAAAPEAPAPEAAAPEAAAPAPAPEAAAPEAAPEAPAPEAPARQRVPETYRITVIAENPRDTKYFLEWLALVENEAFGAKSFPLGDSYGSSGNCSPLMDFIKRDVHLEERGRQFRANVHFQCAVEMPLCCDESLAHVLLFNANTNILTGGCCEMAQDLDQKVNGFKKQHTPILVLFTEWKKAVRRVKNILPFNDDRGVTYWEIFRNRFMGRIKANVEDGDLWFIPLQSGANAYFAINPVDARDRTMKVHAIKNIHNLVHKMLLEHARQLQCHGLRALVRKQDEIRRQLHLSPPPEARRSLKREGRSGAGGRGRKNQRAEGQSSTSGSDVSSDSDFGDFLSRKLEEAEEKLKAVMRQVLQDPDHDLEDELRCLAIASAALDEPIDPAAAMEAKPPPKPRRDAAQAAMKWTATSMLEPLPQGASAVAFPSATQPTASSRRVRQNTRRLERQPLPLGRYPSLQDRRNENNGQSAPFLTLPTAPSALNSMQSFVASSSLVKQSEGRAEVSVPFNLPEVGDWSDQSDKEEED